LWSAELLGEEEIVEKGHENFEDMREIIEDSLGETRSLITLNQDALSLLDQQIKDFEQANPSLNSTTRPELIALKSQKLQLTASVNQARQALRTNEYNADEDNTPSEISELNKEVTLRQLDIQRKQLDINLAVLGLQTKVAQINESLMYPTAPFAGTIQRVFVKEKQSVKAGDPLFVISQTEQTKPITAVAFVSSDVAKRVSRIEPSTLHIGNKSTYTSIPSFVSTEAVQGTLYAIYYPIPEQYSKDVVSEGFISVDMPIGMANTTMVATYVPLDAVYQTREKAYVFVVNGDKAKSKDVQLGQVYGDSVEIVSGLKNGDQVILNRNIIAGDKITVQ
jgi:multidrug efflux pump subunit AcrA (membrane-fusion protein)